jgi:hypothetical protein
VCTGVDVLFEVFGSQPLTELIGLDHRSEERRIAACSYHLQYEMATGAAAGSRPNGRLASLPAFPLLKAARNIFFYLILK